jgi:aryl-alcohol dehydrogenase-like predicted oxidoreductase
MDEGIGQAVYHARTMKYRRLGKTGYNVSEVSFGAWAIGGSWGTVDDTDSLAALRASVDAGVNFIDTADVYGDGRSEKLIARLKSERPRDTIYVATKAGRRLSPHADAGYNRENLTAFVERSLKNLATDALDLLQLHCPPITVYYRPEVFGVLDDLVRAGKLRNYGASVAKVEEGLHAMDYPGVAAIQIIYNCFRQRPADLFLTLAKKNDVGVLARLPLSSGLLSGKITAATTFAKDDHRNFNRQGEAFDKGETFSGIDFDLALKAVDQLRPIVPTGMTMAQFALKWCLANEGVTCVIPGAKNPEQAAANAAASDLPNLTSGQLEAVRATYNSLIKSHVHNVW